ncbi:l-ornithine n5-oxygenase [Ceratocystis lukuohia]|uniref:L-ornithine N(5)-monooxygenase [NAD(P)H] n=1 Tax=Ceratocystis lukuohia TaxID=2019550 RepID=A0ABR4MQW8_9PEZI
MAPHLDDGHLELDSASDGISSPVTYTPPASLNGLSHNSPSGHVSSSSASVKAVLPPTSYDEVHDLVCLGFGPASLSVAVATHDAIVNGRSLRADGRPPKIAFLEKQPEFAWHPGMLIPNAKMQISFIKDLATMRDPRSRFTFLNYLHSVGRLVDFINLSTFLPARAEFEDYLRWCASHFDHLVQYSQEAFSVTPDIVAEGSIRTFTVKSRNVHTGRVTTIRSKNVLIGVGGQAKLPTVLDVQDSRVLHSSQYMSRIHQLLKDRDTPYKVAVVGGGQSAAEIFANVQTLYPNSRTSLIMRSEFLRPSDDSPFINSVFNPEFTEDVWNRSPAYRKFLLTEARATNYGVVRLELIEALFERMYEQKRELGPDESRWPHRIYGGRNITSLEQSPKGLKLKMEPFLVPSENSPVVDEASGSIHAETLDLDLIIAATGYQRRSHVDILKDMWNLLPEKSGLSNTPYDGWSVDQAGSRRCLAVDREYRVKFLPGTVEGGSGIYLQGCCEGTHGISDTLLSVLSIRSGEIVDAVFKSI